MTTINPWNLAVRNEGADKVLDIDVFGVIGDGWFSDVTSGAIARQLADNRDAKRINVRVNSVGGDVFAGVAIYNMLRGHGAEIVINVVGLAASIASIVAMAGKTVMGPGAMMMIHNPWTVVAGDAKEMRRMAADLDKVRDSLVAIYQAKTGKSAADLRALLDAETLMTAEQAKRNGFADEVSGDAAPVEARGDEFFFNSIAFPRAALPAQILAMAKAPEPAVETPAPQAITRDLLAADAPDLLSALLDEGAAPLRAELADARAALSVARAEIDTVRAEGKGQLDAALVAERARLQAIDKLVIHGHADLVAAAKYGPEPMTAAELAVKVLEAGNAAGAAHLAALRSDTAPLSNVHSKSPDAAALAEKQEAAVKSIAQGGNAHRGGVR